MAASAVEEDTIFSNSGDLAEWLSAVRNRKKDLNTRDILFKRDQNNPDVIKQQAKTFGQFSKETGVDLELLTTDPGYAGTCLETLETLEQKETFLYVASVYGNHLISANVLPKDAEGKEMSQETKDRNFTRSVALFHNLYDHIVPDGEDIKKAKNDLGVCVFFLDVWGARIPQEEGKLSFLKEHKEESQVRSYFAEESPISAERTSGQLAELVELAIEVNATPRAIMSEDLAQAEAKIASSPFNHVGDMFPLLVRNCYQKKLVNMQKGKIEPTKKDCSESIESFYNLMDKNEGLWNRSFEYVCLDRVTQYCELALEKEHELQLTAKEVKNFATVGMRAGLVLNSVLEDRNHKYIKGDGGATPPIEDRIMSMSRRLGVDVSVGEEVDRDRGRNLRLLGEAIGLLLLPPGLSLVSAERLVVRVADPSPCTISAAAAAAAGPPSRTTSDVSAIVDPSHAVSSAAAAASFLGIDDILSTPSGVERGRA